MIWMVLSHKTQYSETVTLSKGTGVEISRSTNCDDDDDEDDEDDDEEDDVEDDNYLRMGTGVEVSRSASENCPTATPTRHNTRP